MPLNGNDSQEVRTLFDEFNIVPFFTSNAEASHGYIEVLENLTGLSASHKACKKDIKTYSFGSVDGLEDENGNPATDQQKEKFFEILSTHRLSTKKIHEIIESVYDNVKDFGNAYVRIKVLTLKDQSQVYLSTIHPSQIAYLKTDEVQDKMCIITEKWDREYWKKHRPEILPINLFSDLSVNWKDERKGGVRESQCIVHIKTKNDKSDYYGRPDILPVVNWMFTEWQMSETAGKTAGTEFVSKFIMFFEEVDPARQQSKANLNNGGTQAGGLDRRMMKLRELTTVEGADPKSIVGMDYPFGQKEPKIEKLDVFRDVNYTKSMLEIASSYIFAVWSWAKELTGMASFSGSIGGNIVFDLFRVKNISTIRPTQEEYSGYYWELVRVIFDKLGLKEKVFCLKYSDLIREIISVSENTNNTSGGSTV